jgi:hypothetical protein
MRPDDTHHDNYLTKELAAQAYAEAWNTLDPIRLESLLDDNVCMTSQVMFEDLTSKTGVMQHITGKMRTISNKPHALVFGELGETQTYPAYRLPPEACVVLAQGSKDNVLACVLFRTALDSITQINICNRVPLLHTIKRSGVYPA